MKNALRALALVGLTAAAASAKAQVLLPGSYTPLLDAGSPLAGVTGTEFGWADVALNGWQFPYFGTTTQTISVNAQGYLAVGSGVTICDCTSEAGDPANLVGPGCQLPATSCDSTLPQCGGGCCSSSALNCSNTFCGGGCCDCEVDFSSSLIAPFSYTSLTDVGVNGISYLQGLNDAGHFLTVDYNGVQTDPVLSAASCFTPPCGASSFQFQVTLQESGDITFSYGQTAPLADGGGLADQSLFATPGILDNGNLDTGSPDFFSAAPCCASFANEESCSCGATTWQPNTVMIFGLNAQNSSLAPLPPPVGPYVVPQPVQLSNVAVDAGSISFGVSTTLANVGSTAVSGAITYSVYLTQQPYSVDLLPACSGAPPCLEAFGPFAETLPLTIDGGPTLSPPDSFVVDDPPFGVSSYYYAEIWVDPNDSLGTANPRESIAVSAPLPFGVDLTGSIGSLPSEVSASRPLTIPLTLDNLGLAPSGTFAFQVYLTAAPGVVNTLTDFLLPPGGSESLGPEGSAQLDYVADIGAVPNGGVPLGSYYVTLSLPTAGDLNPLNNVVSVGPIEVSPAHLVVTNVEAPLFAFPGYPTDVSYTLANTGADDAPVGDGGFTILTLIHPQSQGSHFNRSNEPQMQELDGVSIKAGCTAQITDAHIVSESTAGCAYIPPVPDGGQRPIVPATSFGTPLAPGLYLVGVYADPFRVVPGSNPAEPSEAASVTPTTIAAAAPDYTVFAGDLIAPPTGVAGEQMTAQVTLSNIGVVSGSTPYGYYMSSVGQVNTGGVPVAVLTADGGVTYRPQSGTIDYQGSGQPDQVTNFDVLLLPSGMPAGTYTLTVAIDPDEVTDELSRANDLTAAQSPIQVSADPLQVVTSTRLPSAEVNVAYSVQLAAEGGLSGYAWTLLGGSLPAGFTLNAAGILAGLPVESDVGNYALLVQVQSGDQTQVVALLLAVTDGSAPIQILTEGASLPPATVGLTYEEQLAAQGGVPPYVWTGAPPGGGTIVLEQSGLLSGTPNANSITAGPQSFTVTVSDQIGNSAQAAFALDIISPATLTITTDVSGCSASGECPANINPQVVGQPMQVEFTAVEPGTHQFTWELPVGQALPSGLVAVTDTSSPGNQGFVIRGTPGQVGVFPFRLLVTDELEHSTERHFILIVGSTAITLPDGGLIQALPDAVQGQTYPSTQLNSSAITAIDFSLYAQDLPPGLTLGSGGIISGTCSATAALRPWAFTVSATDSSGNQALLPFVIMVDAPKYSGCTTGSGVAAVWLVLLALALWRRRSQRALALVAGLAVGLTIVATPGVARAQATNCSYRISAGTDPYVDITSNPATISLSAGALAPTAVAYATQILPFPLPTPSGEVFDLYAWSNGVITDISNVAEPTIQSSCVFPYASSMCTPPDVAIAPWWGDLSLCQGGTVSMLASGNLDAGTAVITLQWQGVSDDQGSCPAPTDGGFATYSFQAKLSQSGDLEFIYGAATPVAGDLCSFNGCAFAVGAEAFGPTPVTQGLPFSNPSGTPALSCNAGCQSTDFPSGTGNSASVSLLLGPDVQATALGVGGNLSLGAIGTLTADVANVGSGPAAAATLTIYFSTDGVTQGPQLGPAIAIPSLPACTPAQPVVASFTLPGSVVSSVGYLIGVIADPGDSDPEGKSIVSAPFNVLAPESNYTASDFSFTVGQAGSVAPGGTLPVTWTAANTGAAAHAGTTYAYFISRATTITPSDLQLPVMDGGAALNLSPGTQQLVADVVEIPATLPPGAFTVGVIIDPLNTFVEQSKLDNLAVASAQLEVISPTFSVATTSLPPATLGVSYAQTLEASGGDGSYTWTSASLPTGFTLNAAGTLAGSPTAIGTFPVTVTVTDGKGVTANASLTLTVNPLSAPLAIVTATLPGAQVNETYQVALSAIGGSPPYQWCGAGGACPMLPASMPALNGVLPPGLAFSSDGVLSGVPEANGTYAFQVAVIDSATPPNVVTSLELPLHVTASGAVSVSTSSLPVAQLSVPYVGQLAAAGGQPPVTWALLDARRLPSAPGDPGADLQTAMPSGLTLETATGQIIGTPLAAGDFVLLLEVTDSSMPAEVASDNVLLQVLPSEGLQILNSSLPSATVGETYDALLDTNAVNATVTFTPVDTDGQNTPAARATLPPGLALSSSGTLSGIPTAVGQYSFLIEATDSEGRVAIQSFFVAVAQRSGSGCGTAAGDFGWLALWGVGALWRRRRN